MPGNQVTLTFAGESSSAEKAFAKVGQAADEMADEVGAASKEIARTGESFDAVGEKAGTVDTRMMGFRDGITGVTDTWQGMSSIMKGDISGGSLFQLGAGLGDLASSVENLAVPLAKTVGTWVAGHATMAMATVSSVATQIASWISLGITSLISAAQVAAAWLLSVWPIALVIAAVVGLAILIYKNWDTIKEVISAGWRWVARVSGEVWDGIKAVIGTAITAVKDTIQRQIDLVMTIFGGIKTGVTAVMGGLADAITAPFKAGFGAVKAVWNNTVGGFGFKVPDWIPGVGGKGFSIPKMASGGIVTRPTLALIGEAGPEAVVPLSRASGLGGRQVIEFRSSGNPVDDLILEVVRRAVYTRGGVSAVFAA